MSERHQRGLTLVELLVAMVLAGFVVLAAVAVFVACSALSGVDADAREVEDTLRFASHVVQRVVRQAGYVDYTPDGVDAGRGGNVPLRAARDDDDTPDIVGARDARVGASDDGHGRHDTYGFNASDSLRVRFFGHSRADGRGNDGSAIDCMGFAQPTVASSNPVPLRAWSFFYVTRGADGEPALFCKYRSAAGGFRSHPLARGVEVFRVLYGHDADGDGIPERWLDAAQIDAMEGDGGDAHAGWRGVVALRVGIVARGAMPRPGRDAQDPGPMPIHPLGPEFPGSAFEVPRDGRLRRVSTFTVALRNSQRGFALIVVLMLLLVVGVLALGVAQLALLGERGARNQRDTAIAFEAAEAALVDAERDLLGPNTSPAQRLCLFDGRDTGPFVAGCGTGGLRQGLCAASAAGAEPAWTSADFSAGSQTSVVHGTFTGRAYLSAGGSGGLPVRAPRYVIEALRHRGGWRNAPLQNASARSREPTHLYRVTAVGFGPSENARVTLQATVLKPFASPGCP